MNALVRKEARLLLPSFVLGLVLALSIWLIPDGTPPGLPASLVSLAFMVSPAMLVVMTLGSFGRELSVGTFSFLLAQPVSRSRVWWTKTLLLAAAVGLIWAVWWLSLSSNRAFLAGPKDERNDLFLMTVLFDIAVYSGGLWTTLLFRQLAAAFWFTLLTPAALAMGIVGVFHKRLEAVDPVLEPALVIAFSIYSVAGFLFARWLFLRAQDTHWTGGEISLPEWRGMAGWFGSPGERRRRGSGAALWMKELQLHQSQFVLAGVLALLHLVTLAARKWGGDFKNSPALEFVLEQFWVLWLAMPLLVGCAAVAEERKLGTLEGQLCLPSRRRTQFMIKLASALLLSVLLGIAMPMLFEGARILPDFSPSSGAEVFNFAIYSPDGSTVPLGGILGTILAVLPFVALAGIAAAIALASFYVSTLARNTLQALAPAVLGILVTWFILFTASAPEQFFHYRLWRGGLVYLIGVPVMTVSLAGLMYWNFKRVLVGWNVWRRNAFVLLAALGGVTAVTTATYHRVWEHFMTLEPPHGPARLDRSQPVAFWSGGYNDIALQFPDGRNWSSRLLLSVPNWASMLSGDWKVAEVPGSAGYLEGTNWASVAKSLRDVVGLQRDGSLWVSKRPEKFPAVGLPNSSPNPAMIRLGNDSDWKSVAGQGSRVFLLKTNGTLWSLGARTGRGTNRVSWKDWPGFGAFAPERLGTDADWAKFSIMKHGRMAFQKTDGRTWVYPPYLQNESDKERMELDVDVALSRATYFDGQKSVVSTWTSAPPGRNFIIGVGEDGMLRVIAYWGWVGATNGRQGKWRLIPERIPLGHETNWLALDDNHQDIGALKADGSLWKWSFPTDPTTRPDGVLATRLSQHSDWVAFTEAMDGMVGLAADGSLWFWAMERRSYFPSAFTLQPLLAASRRPQLIGNIFARPPP